MTVLMTGMATNRIYVNSGRLLSLLLLFITVCCSNAEKEAAGKNAEPKELISTRTMHSDSLEITVKNIPAGNKVSFFYEGEHLGIEYIHFENTTATTQSVTKKILKTTDYNLALYYRTFSSVNHKNIRFYYDYFLDPAVHTMVFTMEGPYGDLKLQDHDGKVIRYDDMTNEYEKINNKTNRASAIEKISKLENLYTVFRKKFPDNEHQLINDLSFHTQLSVISPGDKRIKAYLEHITDPIWSRDISLLMYNYLTVNKDQIYLLALNQSRNDTYNRLIEIGIAWHLRQFKESDRRYANYDKNVQWFKNTAYYKKNKLESDQSLSVEKEDLNAFKADLFSFDIHDGNTIRKIQHLIADHTSPYYLLDFWATWCAPCLQNIETMHTMQLPADIEVIYISMDKTRDREKWSKKSRDLALSNSYLFAESQHNKSVIKNISLNQLPRYILVDKDYNILHFDFAVPQDSDFLKELKIITHGTLEK